MRIIKFTINEDYYDALKIICGQEDITIKKKINVLLSNDIGEVANTKNFFPEDFSEKPRTITLKVNEELYKGVVKRADILGIKPSKYLPYLIYRFLND
jgi:predicted DNA binding CopG/RHH family protein